MASEPTLRTQQAHPSTQTLQSLQIPTPRHILHGLHHAPPQNPFRARTLNIPVEPSPKNLSETLLYAPDAATPLTPTTFIRVHPTTPVSDLVCRGDAFHISFIGFSITNPVPSHQPLLHSRSPHSSSFPTPADTLTPAAARAFFSPPTTSQPPHRSSRSTDRSATPPTPPHITFLPPEEPVYIHHDPLLTPPAPSQTFVQIPAQKSRYHHLPATSPILAPSTTEVRFSLTTLHPISNLPPLPLPPQTPYLHLLTRAIALATTLARPARTPPTTLLERDVRFLLAEPTDTSVPRSGDYLRYGYYFFLDRPVEARLYAQTGSSGQTVPLFMKRVGTVPELERRYFPLTGVSYVVVRVARGEGEGGVGEVDGGGRERLEGVLQMSRAVEMLSGIGKRRAWLFGRRCYEG